MPNRTPHALNGSPFRRWRVLLLALMAVVSWFAFMPQSASPNLLPWGDKVQHLLAFAALSAAAMLAGPPTWRHATQVAAALLLYGLFIEGVQMSLPGRVAEWADVLADAAGIALGQTVGIWWRTRPRTRRALEP